jgi:uncharacterized protein YjbI with pentapeptide repeats
MANKDHLERLTSRFSDWNEWRARNPDIVPDLFKADLEGKLLIGMDLSGANLDRAKLNRVDLRRADLTRASICNASIYDAHFNEAILQQTDLCGSIIIRSSFLEARMRGVKLRAEIQKVNFQKASFQCTDLSEVKFRECDFAGADLTDARLSDASIVRSSLSWTDLSRATMDRIDLTGSQLNRTKLTECSIRDGNFVNTSLVQTDLSGADITGCQVYGTSVWDVATNEATQQTGLIIQGPGNPKVVVDDIEVAQFIYALFSTERLRLVIDTVTSKVVLILGRFTEERKNVLDALRDELRNRNYIPVLFDFEKPDSRDLTEMISTLAHMARFVIADITDAKSIPQELMRIVPNLPSLPVRPIILDGQYEYAMFKDFGGYLSVLPPWRYQDSDHLLASLETEVIGPALSKAQEIAERRIAFERELMNG